MICDGLKVTLPGALALSTDQHREVRQRMVWCEQALQPAEAGEIGAVVAGLLIVFPSAQLSETTARVRARAYHTALEDIPGWALAAAANKWLRGQVEGGNPDFAPSPPRLRQMAELEVNAVRGHLVNLRRLAAAEVERDIPEDERARVAARFKSLLASAPEAQQGA